MESLPSDILDIELPQMLDVEELAEYCATAKRIAKICQSKSFWSYKVAHTPRRVLQDDWFLGLASLGETVLLELLLNAIDKVSLILLDNWAIAYAALDLIDQRHSLSEQGLALMEQLIGRAETDPALERAIVSDSFRLGVNLRNFYHNVRERALTVREELESGDSTIWAYSRNETYYYLGDYVNDFIYEENIDLIPSMYDYIDRVPNITVTEVDYTSPGGKVITSPLGHHNMWEERYNYVTNFICYFVERLLLLDDIEQIKKILRLVQTAPLPIGITILSYATEEQAVKLVTKYGLTGWKRYLNGFPDICPLDKRIYQNLVRLSDYIIDIPLGPYRCFEPEEWISYLENLVRGEKISEQDMNSAMRRAAKNANSNGYSYFANVINAELGFE